MAKEFYKEQALEEQTEPDLWFWLKMKTDFEQLAFDESQSLTRTKAVEEFNRIIENIIANHDLKFDDIVNETKEVGKGN